MSLQHNADAAVSLGGHKEACSFETADCIFLFGTVLLSALPYLPRIGFYSDDWAYQATLSSVSGESLAAMFRALLVSDPNMLTRPVQATFLVLEFSAFGRHALPYHIVCTMILGIVTILLYLVLKELRAERLLAFVIALVFGLLPHYSTDRIWISSQQATLSMAFAFLGIYTLLRSVRPEVRRPLAWVALGASALVLSFLSYEVAIGLIAASVGMIAWRWYHYFRTSPQRFLVNLVGFAGAAAVLLAVGVLKTRMQTRLVYHHRFSTHLGALTWHAINEAVRFNFWTYGLHMPAVLAALYRHSALSLTTWGSTVSLACLVAAYLWRNMGTCEIPSRRTCLRLLVSGFAVFGLGYALLFSDIGTDFSTAGLSNRTEIASALGASCTLVAVAGIACSVPRSQNARKKAFGLMIGLICGVNCLAVNGIGFFWGTASSQQQLILRSVAANVRALPRGSVLLLDGFCRYSGPGVVFETDWDTSGAIELTLRDYSLVGDVVSPNLHFENDAAETTMSGKVEGQYPYGSQLLVYNVRHNLMSSLPSKEAALGYLRAINPTGDSGCPAAKDGYGEKVF